MNTKLPITIVTAVLNEEKRLPAFLRYAQSLAQEVIVVVDFRTHDASADIAKRAGVHVLMDDGESKGIVFHNKNRGIKEAKYNWILILDTDERPDQVMEQEIKAIVSSDQNSEVMMYQTGFINIEFGQRFETCDQKKKKFIRLFRKGSFEYTTNKTAEGFGVHTKSLGSSWMLKVPGLRTWKILQNPRIQNLKGYLIHDSHPTVSDFIRKINHYSDREAKILFENDKHPSILVLTIKLVINPTREFIQKYVIWKMYKEGARGAIASILYAFYHFLIYAKYLQLQLLSNADDHSQTKGKSSE